MSAVSYTLKSTVRRAAADAVPGKGEAASLKILAATRSCTSRTTNDTLKFVTLPSNARIHALSRVHWDDLASTGSPTLSLGVAPTTDPSNAITASATCLNSGLDLATATNAAALLGDHANAGKTLWELLGLTSDPGVMLDIYGTFAAANTNTTGDVTLEVAFSFD